MEHSFCWMVCRVAGVLSDKSNKCARHPPLADFSPEGPVAGDLCPVTLVILSYSCYLSEKSVKNLNEKLR